MCGAQERWQRQSQYLLVSSGAGGAASRLALCIQSLQSMTWHMACTAADRPGGVAWNGMEPRSGSGVVGVCA